MSVDLRDLSVVGQTPTEIFRAGDEIPYLKAVTDWKRKSVSKKGKPLSLYAFPGTRVVKFPDGSVKVIKWTSKRGAHFVPFESYRNSLVKEARIPKQLINKIRAAEGHLTIPGLGMQPIPHGAGEGFAKWFAEDIMGEQLTERDFWNRLGKLYQDYGYEPKTWRSSVSRDLSHFHPRSKGGRFTFVEHWLVNQSRGARTFIPLGNLKQAQIPITYEDLFDHYRKYVIGNEPKPWYGELNNLNLDDINALARGNSVPEVVTRRNNINRILTQALAGESVSSDAFLQLNDDYIRLIQE